MKKSKIKFIIATAIMLCITCVTVYASSYTTTLAFQGEHKGSTREFDGQNIMYAAATYSSAPDSVVKVYTVSLYRKKFIGSTLIGKSKELQRDAYNEVKWSNVGAGKYYLYFTKARDGINVYSNKVTIKNY